MSKKIEEMSDKLDKRNEEKGDALTFFIGLVVFCVGAFMIFKNTDVHTAFRFGGWFSFMNNFPTGVVLLPLIIGVMILFFSDNSILGWLFVIIGLAIILVGILMGLEITFRRTDLFTTIMMYGMTAAGVGLILKGLYGKSRK